MQKRRAFTLVELLVVLAVVAILMAIVLPVFGQARKKAQAVACLSNCRQAGLALAQYIQDYDGVTPTIDKQVFIGIDGTSNAYNNWYNLLMPYTKNWYVFICPNDPRTFSATTTANDDSNHLPSGNDPYDCWDDLNPTGHCIGYGYNDGWVTDGGFGLLQMQTTDNNLPKRNVLRAGRNVSEIASPAQMVAFGDNATKKDGSIGCDAAVKWAVAGGPITGFPNSVLTSTSQLRHDQLLNFVFVDGHVHAIRMVIANCSSWNLNVNGGNPLQIPANAADALDWCYDPSATSTYYDQPANANEYPLPNRWEGSSPPTCANAVNYIYANSTIAP